MGKAIEFNNEVVLVTSVEVTKTGGRKEAVVKRGRRGEAVVLRNMEMEKENRIMTRVDSRVERWEPSANLN